MPGFIAHIGEAHFTFAPEIRKKLVVDYVEGKGFQVERRVVNKFMNDRIFSETPDFFVLVEGVVLNNHELMERYACSSWLDCVLKMYESEGDAFFSAFRGSFSGALLDKKHNKWLIYTCHTGEKQVFVSQTPDGYIFGSEMDFIVRTRKLNNLPVSFNPIGANMTLTYGFCIEDQTLVQEIIKLGAGHYLCLQNGRLEDVQYHRFCNTPKEMTVEEAVEGIDHYFRQSIRRAFEKDREYGYRHIACLSGGLDSRMTVWVAHEMGYTNQLNITYSQSGYLDFSIAQQIATDLHHDWLFKPLDGGDCIDTIDEVTPLTYGAANFFGLAHGRSMENLINYEPFGLIHTGQLGDVILGTYLKKMEYGQVPKPTDGAYSQEIIDRVMDYRFRYEYQDAELFMMYNRGFCGIAQGLLTFQENSESYSPFCDVDFFEFCYSIPIRLRFGHKIYFDWILSKYPAAAEYIWENTRTKIARFENKPSRYMNVLGYKVPHYSDPAFPSYLRGFIKRRLGLAKKGQKAKTLSLTTKDDMNPVDYWYATNPHLREFMNSYWQTNEHLLPEGQMRDDMRHLFYDCVLYDKLQAMTVLSALKLINQ